MLWLLHRLHSRDRVRLNCVWNPLRGTFFRFGMTPPLPPIIMNSWLSFIFNTVYVVFSLPFGVPTTALIAMVQPGARPL